MNKTQLIGHTIEDIVQPQPDKVRIFLSSGDIIEIEAMFIAGSSELSLLMECNGKEVEGL